ncbi:MAG: hypothetical protein PHR35_18600 [Kiritimatiellae bacterium]|nr:hypothetical protein [Kiritimatiellia bacterium]
MDLRQRLELSGTGLMAMLDREHEYLPTQGYECAHDLGRWWDAALRLEETVGFAIPAELEAASLRNLQLLTDNPDRLLMNNEAIPFLKGKAGINPHNFRETLLAFGGLVRWRRNQWARVAALQLVGAMSKALRPDGSFAFEAFGSWGRAPFTQDPSHTEAKRGGWFDGTATSGRAIEALVWLYETTCEPRVLELARRIAEHHLANSTCLDGSMRPAIVDPENVGHNHSYHGTLRGLLLFGLLTGQHHYVEVIEATYRKAVRLRLVHESGWAPHDLGKLRFPNAQGDPVAEPSSAGDSAQLALWLALRAGHDDLLDDVERLVRARLLPMQVTEDDMRTKPGHHPREMGAWGVYGSCHAEKRCTPDVHAAVIHSLCDIHAHILTSSAAGARVNLHFDAENAALKVVCTRSGETGSAAVTVKRPGNVLIRIPGWAPEASLRLAADGRPLPLRRLGHFAFISADTVGAGGRIELTYALPRRNSEETMLSGRRYRFAWVGDEIVGVDPQDSPDPFYPALEAAHRG